MENLTLLIFYRVKRDLFQLYLKVYTKETSIRKNIKAFQKRFDLDSNPSNQIQSDSSDFFELFADFFALTPFLTRSGFL